MSKYGAQKTVVDGITFDSKAEARRYSTLQLMVRVGQITNLERQPTYELVPGVKYAGAARAKPALRYKPDFRYVKDGKTVVEDVKGVKTQAFEIRRHLMKHIHNIDILVTS